MHLWGAEIDVYRIYSVSTGFPIFQSIRMDLCSCQGMEWLNSVLSTLWLCQPSPCRAWGAQGVLSLHLCKGPFSSAGGAGLPTSTQHPENCPAPRVISRASPGRIPLVANMVHEAGPGDAGDTHCWPRLSPSLVPLG